MIFACLEANCPFLGNADEDHTFLGAELAAITVGNIVFALAFLKVHERNLVLGGKCFQFCHEFVRDLTKQCRRSDLLTTVFFQKMNQTTGLLQCRYIPIEIDAINALNFQ